MRSYFFKKLAVMALLVLCTGLVSYAQFEEGKELVTVTKITGSALANTSPYEHAIQTYAPDAYENQPDRKIKNIISFRMDENSTTFFASGFTATVNFDIESKATLASSPVTTSKTLIVNYDNTTGATYKPLAYIEIPVAEYVKITITNFVITGNSGWDPTPILELSNEMRVTRYYSLSANPTLLTPAFGSPVDNTDNLEVSWTWPAGSNNNMSQLEWAWVEDEMAGFYPSTAKLFEENSTRVDLDAGMNSFKIPLLYNGSGKLYYRVRAALRKNSRQVITGAWHDASYFSFTGHEPKLNWQSSTSFAENGKLKSVIQYFDGSLRGRQTVTKDNSTNNTIVGETIYDLQGRPNIQILPTPTADNTIQYFSNFNRFLGQGLNQDPSRYFDLTPVAIQCNRAPALDSNYGNAKYYSNQNPWLALESKSSFIPDAKGYAFTETRFMDDATGRIRSQGGVGLDHQIGSGHETKYYYGKPSQAELDALFATEAGYASHYSKNMVQDANGQMSVSYVDMHGRTVATALAGNPTPGIDSIINNTDYPLAVGLVKNDLTTPDNNIIQGRTIESVSSILVSAYNEYKFTYQLDPAILSLFSCNAQQICFDCKYDLEISIKGEGCGDTTPIIRRYQNLQAVPSNQACSTSMGFKGPGADTLLKKIFFSENLQPGSYVIRKTLTVNDSVFQVRRDSALKVFLCKSEQDIYDSVLNILTIASGCNVPADSVESCKACLLRLGFFGTYRNKYLVSIGVDISNTDYDELITQLYTQDSLDCIMACSISPAFSTLYGLRKRMLNDMIPYSGQYALDSTVNNLGVRIAIPSTNLEAKYNIFSPAYTGSFPAWSYTKPFYKYPLAENGAASFYKEEDGFYSGSVYPSGSGSNSFLLSLTREQFTNLFQRQWADNLLKYHPEFVKLQLAEGSLKASYEWMDKVQTCESYAAAVAWGYTSPVANDPYFTGAFVPGDGTKMNTYLTSYIGTNTANPSIWRMANGMALCKGLPDNQKAACIAGKSATGIEPGITDSLVKNEIWENFKSIYFSYRNEMLLAYINSATASQLSQTAMDQLQAERKMLHFANAQDLADQNGLGGNWTNVINTGDTTGTGFNPGNFPGNADKCAAQRIYWKQRLLQCDTLVTMLNTADSTTAKDIIEDILDGLESVCNNSIDAQNPYGASTVRPGYAGSPKSFEEVITTVFSGHGIVTPPNQYFCNPYSVDYPKPYGSNPQVAINNSNQLDSCACTQFIKHKQEAFATGFDTLSLSSMNEFFLLNYNDSINAVLWEGFQKCDTSFRDSCTWVYGPVNAGSPETPDMQGGKDCEVPVVTNVQHVIVGGVQYLQVFYQTNADCVTDTLRIRDTTGIFIVNMAIPCGTGNILVPLSHCNDYVVRIFTNSEKCGPQQSANVGILRSEACRCPVPRIDSLNFVLPHPLDSTQNVQIHYDISSGLINCKLKTLVDDGAGPIPYSTQTISCGGSSVTVNLPACHKYLFYIETENPEWNEYCDSLTLSDTMVLDECWQKVCVKLFTPITLSDVVRIPTMFRCGYVKPCITCDTLKSYVQQFRVIYPAFAAVPYMSPDATPEQTEENGLLARFINFRTGFSKNAIDYMMAWRRCGLDSCGGGGSAPDHLILNARSYPYPASYIARVSIEMNDGFESLADDEFIAFINSELDSCSTSMPGDSIAICGDSQPTNDPTGIFVPNPNPCEDVETQAGIIAQQLYQQMKDSLIAKFDSLYLAKCLEAKYTEQFYVEYKPKEYHFTLYYYDQAGNLVKTLPPAAVKPNYGSVYLAAVASNRAAATDYATGNNELLATQYRYNTLNQVISQKTPDGGTSHFWYDRLGRLAVSQNAKQAAAGKYSYTLYDALGRITQVGQKPQTTAMTDVISKNETSLAEWLNKNGVTVDAQNKEEITRTVYDVSYFNGDNLLLPEVQQENLRNRVSYTQVFDAEPTGTESDITRFAGTHRAATHYSYDIHGNVDVLLQDYNSGKMKYKNPGLSEPGLSDPSNASGNRFKKMEYSYDLVSGKVNSVAYQAGYPDQFYHRYKYDAENRLTETEVSYDKIYWERDAKYDYYRHGPLARTILGQNQVQGLDYAYTIQGWMKGVNAASLHEGLYDMGADGSVNLVTARDEMSFALNYFAGDYKPVGGSNPFVNNLHSLTNTNSQTVASSLYNGNIASMFVNMPKLGDAMLYGYRYDQLNRIKSMDAFTGFNSAANNYGLGATATGDYKERVGYDPNGNIMTYLRNGLSAGGGLDMDDLVYQYETNANKLKRVKDNSPGGDGAYPTDIDDQANANNYQYDAIGNLISDASEGITDISWSVYGKILSITKSAGTIFYTYDASGNRISKTYDDKTTWYVRDASGNVMSTYVVDAGINSGHLTQSEIHLYGSNRLGIINAATNVEEPVSTNGLTNFERGRKFFELGNHLGNVLVTVSDKKKGDDTDSDGDIDYFNADVVTANDYYPFGMLMPGRSYTNGSSYRYGFNGKENDNEVKGEGNQQDYGMRIYDLRLGRFLSVDPIAKRYPFVTPYAFAENDVIRCIDLDGLEKYNIIGRSFAPRGSFENTHFESKADDRTKFELAKSLRVSARIHIQLTVDLDKRTIDENMHSQPTILKGGSKWNIWTQHMETRVKADGAGGFTKMDMDTKYYAKNGTEFGPGIDISINTIISRWKNSNEVVINTQISGNVFPAQETMIFDSKGTGLFLGVSTAEGNPLTGVWGSGESNLLSHSGDIRIQTDADGNFLGVFTTNAQGQEQVVNPKAYNAQFTKKEVWDKQKGRKDYEKN